MTDSEHQETPAAEYGSDAPPALGGSPRTATFDQLIKKKRRKAEFTVTLESDDGSRYEVLIRYLAIGSDAYDKMIGSFPPTTEQKKNGLAYNPDKFGPALISAVCVEPELTVEQATEIWHSPDWAGGEINTLFLNALRLQNAGLDVPFIGPD